jgi:RNA polymerase sigma-70 factor (ECF subfamily)
MDPTPTDHHAIASSRTNPEAFAAVFERHHAALHDYLRRRVGSSLADDLAAEVFAQAFRVRDRYRPLTDDARPWLLGIAGKLVARHRRAEARALAALQREAAAAPREAASSDPADGACWLAAGLRHLSRRDRDALLLMAWGELSYEEIGCALDIPVGTVRSRIHRARQKLARCEQVATTTLGEVHA